jgi:hypothetical protein
LRTGPRSELVFLSFAVGLAELAALDINPLICTPTDVVAADVLLVPPLTS